MISETKKGLFKETDFPDKRETTDLFTWVWDSRTVQKQTKYFMEKLIELEIELEKYYLKNNNQLN